MKPRKRVYGQAEMAEDAPLGGTCLDADKQRISVRDSGQFAPARYPAVPHAIWSCQDLSEESPVDLASRPGVHGECFL